jgi:hypothetical protein
LREAALLPDVATDLSVSMTHLTGPMASERRA